VVTYVVIGEGDPSRREAAQITTVTFTSFAEANGETASFSPSLSFFACLTAHLIAALLLVVMSAIMGGSRRPRLYVFVAAAFLAVFFFSLVGFHDVGLVRSEGSFALSEDYMIELGSAYTVFRKRERRLFQHGMDTRGRGSLNRMRSTTPDFTYSSRLIIPMSTFARHC